ncbi:hypothetical protein ES705_16773 [subsurface metagenome]
MPIIPLPQIMKDSKFIFFLISFILLLSSCTINNDLMRSNIKVYEFDEYVLTHLLTPAGLCVQRSIHHLRH